MPLFGSNSVSYNSNLGSNSQKGNKTLLRPIKGYFIVCDEMNLVRVWQVSFSLLNSWNYSNLTLTNSHKETFLIKFKCRWRDMIR